MEKIIAQYENNCNNLAKLFAEKQGLDFDFWVSDIVGGVASFSWHYLFTIDDIVIDLKKRNWSDEKIAKNLGMDSDEVLRLCQIGGLSELFSNKDFSQAWEPEMYEEQDSIQ